MTRPTILFLCPHAAAKSVLAMTYFEQLAAQAGLAFTVRNAGTEPDRAVNPAVAAYLKGEGFDLTNFAPRLLNDTDLDVADIVVSMGCIEADRVTLGTRFLDWSDVPQPSVDFQMSRDKIYAHVIDLVAELAPG